ncbi:hypothetical protein ACTXT7_006726 [Hymenolepis weldensis]
MSLSDYGGGDFPPYENNTTLNVFGQPQKAPGTAIPGSDLDRSDSTLSFYFHLPSDFDAPVVATHLRGSHLSTFYRSTPKASFAAMAS